jgi:hypothetical protein
MGGSGVGHLRDELEIELELAGDGDRDGLTITPEFARLLHVEAPTG